MTNRNPVKQWGITFPQSGEVTKEEFFAHFPPTVAYVMATEQHEDGNPHLHLGLVLKKGMTFSNMKKRIELFYPYDYKRIKFEGLKNMKNWFDYCLKEDPLAVVVWPPEERYNKKGVDKVKSWLFDLCPYLYPTDVKYDIEMKDWYFRHEETEFYLLRDWEIIHQKCMEACRF